MTVDLSEAVMLTPAQVAERLGVSVKTVRRRISAGELPAAKLGRRTLRVAPDAVARYLAEHTA